MWIPHAFAFIMSLGLDYFDKITEKFIEIDYPKFKKIICQHISRLALRIWLF